MHLPQQHDQHRGVRGLGIMNMHGAENSLQCLGNAGVQLLQQLRHRSAVVLKVTAVTFTFHTGQVALKVPPVSQGKATIEIPYLYMQVP